MSESSKPAARRTPTDRHAVNERLRERRQQIDRLDEELVRLLNTRATCALDVGRLKESIGQTTYQPEREIEVLAHVRQVNEGPLEAGAVTRLFERIIDENRRLERLAEEGGAADAGDSPTGESDNDDDVRGR